MEKFLEVKEATRAANKHNDYRSSSVDARQTPRVCFVKLSKQRKKNRNSFSVRTRLVDALKHGWIIATNRSQTRKCAFKTCARSKVLTIFFSCRNATNDDFLKTFSSSANAKKWQEELEILRNNNAKLTTALQESHGNVEEWKRQLQFYRDECSRLRQLVRTNLTSFS